jgi:hypothetical protein
MDGEASSAFDLKPDGAGTHVTWSMEGKQNYMSKVMCMFMNMDKMIGGEYEKGLAKLSTAATAQ